ncbi:UNVERIFIED_CONTAM: hypothetical protein GTU68_036409 [Idotea baltica]|nr:hypothetical protein [Idotea baltica]
MAYNDQPKNLSIKTWHEDDRPREKLIHQGRTSLSNAELIAILIGSGSRSESAVQLAKRILQRCEHNLDELGKLSLEELMSFKGIGQAKAVSIVAALEVGRRRQAADPLKKEQITSSRDSYEILSPMLSDLKHEEFWIIILNQSNKVISKEKISSGGVASSLADPRLIFKSAIQLLASGIILSHNHPSGALRPSDSDIRLTKKLVEAGKVLDVRIIDHVIIGDKGYYSFVDEGML